MQNGPSQGPREAAVPNAITVSVALLTIHRKFSFAIYSKYNAICVSLNRKLFNCAIKRCLHVMHLQTIELQNKLFRLAEAAVILREMTQ